MDGARVEGHFGEGEGVRAGGKPHPDWVERSACPLGPSRSAPVELPRGEGMRLVSFLPDGEFGFQSG